MFSALKKAALTLLNLADGLSTDLYASERGALWVASDNQVAQGVGLIDLSTTDATFAAPGVREIRITTAGNLKVDAPGLDGVTAAITIPVIDGDKFTCQGITKVYKAGTTAAGLVAYK